MKKYHVGIVGVSGIVGQKVLEVLSELELPINKLTVYGSKNSAGQVIRFNQEDIIVKELTYQNIDPSLNVVIMAAGNETALKFADAFVNNGTFVVDNSSAFRTDSDKPLVIPEINAHTINLNTKIIANPNCTTTQGVFPLKVIDNLFGLKRVEYTSFQAVSGSGAQGVSELKNVMNGEEHTFYPHNIKDNVIPLIDKLLDNGFSKEEVKMVNETQKILELPNVEVSATCVRVPMKNTHALSIICEVHEDVELKELYHALEKFNGIVVVDDPANNIYPVASMADGNDLVYVGRIRKDLFNPHIIHLYCVSDNIRKGAATNSVQIAKYILEELGL